MLPIGDARLLERKVPRNHKYDHVGSTVDTGHSLSRHLANLRHNAALHRFRPNELFRRIKPLPFAALLLSASDSNTLATNTTATTTQTNTTTTDVALSVQNWKSNFSVSHIIPPPLSPPTPALPNTLTQSPFLLLDVRPDSHYALGHIVNARHYPPEKILHGANQFTPELLFFRNHPDKLIILYDYDESIAPTVAQHLAERDIHNVWLLSGGLKLMLSKLQGMFIGKLPPTAQSSSTATTAQCSSSSKTLTSARLKQHTAAQSTVAEFTCFDPDALRASMQQYSPDTSTIGAASVRSFATSNYSRVSKLTSATGSIAFRSVRSHPSVRVNTSRLNLNK